MRYVTGGLVVVLVAIGGLVGWYTWNYYVALVAGPPEAVVQAFLQAAQAGDWGKAEAYLTSHTEARIGQAGPGDIERLVATRLHPFTTFTIHQATYDTRGGTQEAAVLVRLSGPVTAHVGPGRIENGQLVHAHRFVLWHEGRAWRIYQFEEADVSP